MGDLSCARCGGPMAKLCPRCQARSSLAKNFCDQCGAGFNALRPQAPSSLGIPQTAIRHGPPPELQAISLPPAGRSMQSFTPLSAATPADLTPAKTTESVFGPKPLPMAVKAVLWILLALGLGLAAWQAGKRREERRPETLVPRLAAQYLEALRRNDAAKAYSMLSRSAQAGCTLEEFLRLRDTAPWSWSGLALARVEPEAVLVQYDLILEGRPPERDYLLFALEDGRWVRPYNWSLLKKIEGAFDRNDPDTALVEAQRAVRINPRDPMARGYLCEAVYYRKIPREIERECVLALGLSQRYPSKLSAKSLYHLHAILGDSYKNALKKYPEAAAEYGVMLSFPNLSPADQCDLFLARSDAYASAGKSPEAAADLGRASGLCAKPADLDYIARRRSALEAR